MKQHSIKLREKAEKFKEQYGSATLISQLPLHNVFGEPIPEKEEAIKLALPQYSSELVHQWLVEGDEKLRNIASRALRNMKDALEASSIVVLPTILVCIMLVLFSAIPWTFTYLSIGKLIFPSSVVEYSILILMVAAISLFSVVASKKLIKNGKSKKLFLSLGIVFLITCMLVLSFSLVFMPKVSEAGKKIDTFVAENDNLDFHHYVLNVTTFLNSNVGAAWNKPEMSLAIDKLVCNTLLDPLILNISGVSMADLILYQGWGSCGESAILIEQLFHAAGYETRLAFFKGIDHEWTETKYNGTWVIVDPWYIGNFVDAQNLRNAKPEFQKAAGVEVRYENGTTVDASHDHGY
jgi:hypothetical protein